MDKKSCRKCGDELPENWTHKKCEACRKKSRQLGWRIFGCTVVTLGLGWLGYNKGIEFLENNRMSDDDLDELREKIRLEHCAGDESAYHKLQVIDKEIYKRAYGSDVENVWHGPPPRENGWYLPNDD